MLSDFRITEELSSSSLWRLCRARRIQSGEPVLLKFLNAGLNRFAPRVSAFQQEYALLEKLQSTAIVRPLDFVQERAESVMVLSDFDGESLETVMETGRMPVETVASFALALSRALGEIHSHDLILTNLNPAGILVNRAQKSVCLVDAGGWISIAADLPAPARARPHEVDWAYISPEMTGRLNQPVDQRTDFYSLGIILYSMITGQLPFQASDSLEWVHCHIARAPRPPEEVAHGIPQVLSDIVMKLLAKSPDDRYQSARGLQFDLEEYLKHPDGFPASFQPGKRDRPDRFQLPQRLYGRAEEIQKLVQTFEEVAEKGRPAHVVVTGYPGIGKTQLVTELERPVLSRNGYFISGKFNQFEVAMPYATIADAFHELVRQILGESETSVNNWRDDFLQALGENGQLMVDLVPQLELIIGPQLPLPTLSPLEANNRFQRVFSSFLSVVARPEHPLVLFLDDLQWADAGSLSLIDHVLLDPETSQLMLITAFRDHEISPSSSLARTFASIRKHLPPVELHLGPLSDEALKQLVSDTLRCDSNECYPLAELIALKTGGNPFFVSQFLRVLDRDGCIFFDPETGAWRWDMDAINRLTVTDNVVDLMTDRISRMDAIVHPVLQTAACLGNRFDSALLSTVTGTEEEELVKILAPAVREGVLQILQSAALETEVQQEVRGNAGHTEYRWPHDRIQQAATLMIAESERDSIHLHIGRALLRKTDPDRLAEFVFDLVKHLNHGIPLITDRTERRDLARLNSLAGEKARKAVAYTSAREYLRTAVGLLENDAWETDYEATFRLHFEFSECLYLSGRIEEADELFSQIIEKATNIRDRAAIYTLRMRLYEASGRYGDGMNTALEALRLFDVSFPGTADKITEAFLAEHEKIQSFLFGRRIADLADQAEEKDPDSEAVLNLLAEAIASCYNANPTLFPLLISRGVNLSLERGITSDSCRLLSFYGILLLSVFRDIPSAYEFSRLALHLNEHFKDARSRGTILYLHAAFINHWKQHIATNRTIMEEAFFASVHVGDYVYAGFNRNDVVWQAFEQGEVIDEILSLSNGCAAFTRQTKNEMQFRLIELQRQFLRALKGRSPDALTLDMPDMSEADCMKSFSAANFGCGMGFFHIMKQILLFLSGRFEEALEEAERTKPLLPAVMGLSIEASHYFYSSLTLAALIPGTSREKKSGFMDWLQENVRLLRLWSQECPENFLHRYALVQAEIARVENREIDAERLYEQAIRSAHENGFLQNEAIANELAGKFYERRKFERIAATYYRDARSCFYRWGASIGVHPIETTDEAPFETALALEASLEAIPAGHTARSNGTAEQPDFLSIAKVSQAISSEILLDRLLDTIMRVALESAGAQVGFLCNIHRDGWAIAADARVQDQEIRVTADPEDTHPDVLLPEAIINYVRRSGERVILADATKPNPFSSDTYIATVRPRSVLCLPIMKQARPIGILYLENNAAPNAFTQDRLTILEMISAQAAISIENARLYSDIKRENRERRMAEEHIRHMAHHDTLTGLPNRVLFRDRVEQSISQAHRNRGMVAVLFIDLDHFKDINDSLGHQIGDHLLQQTGLRLQRCLREGDTIARLGGDEFVFCLPGIRKEDEAILVAERILEILRRPFHIDRYELHVTGSVGISLYPTDSQDVDGLMRAADAAMYHAKESGRDNLRFFTKALNEAANRRLHLAGQLHQALEQRRFALYYQPLVHLGTNTIFSAEALVRLFQPDGETVGPEEFIAIAEETGLIVPLGDWVLEEACNQLKQWRSDGHPNLRMSVNLSPRQFRTPGFPGRMASILDRRGLPAHALDLEITEGVLMTQNHENVFALEEITKMGVRLAIDDFGTGYSSLAYLQRFPIDTLKIDQSFIRGIQSDPGQTAIVNTIIAMANNLDLNVIAEGVETEGQVSFLKSNGCHAAQGFYYSKPIPAESFSLLLKEWNG